MTFSNKIPNNITVALHINNDRRVADTELIPDILVAEVHTPVEQVHRLVARVPHMSGAVEVDNRPLGAVEVPHMVLLVHMQEEEEQGLHKDRAVALHPSFLLMPFPQDPSYPHQLLQTHCGFLAVPEHN